MKTQDKGGDMRKEIILDGDGISVKITSVNKFHYGEVKIEIAITKDGKSLISWQDNDLHEGDTCDISGFHITVPIKLIDV